MHHDTLGYSKRCVRTIPTPSFVYAVPAQMVMVSLPHKPFTYTAKNTARRQAIIHDYQVEIDTLYTMVEESAQAELTPPAVWDLDNTTTFIRTVVNKILKSPVTDDEDIFQRGCDRCVPPLCRDPSYSSTTQQVCRQRGSATLCCTR